MTERKGDRAREKERQSERERMTDRERERVNSRELLKDHQSWQNVRVIIHGVRPLWFMEWDKDTGRQRSTTTNTNTTTLKPSTLAQALGCWPQRKLLIGHFESAQLFNNKSPVVSPLHPSLTPLHLPQLPLTPWWIPSFQTRRGGTRRRRRERPTQRGRGIKRGE